MPLMQLISELQSRNPDVRREAVQKLGHIGGDEAAGALVLLLQDPDPDVRAAVGQALGSFGPDAVPPLLRYLESWKGPVDEVLPTLLGRLGAEASLGFLAKHVADPLPAARSAIASALGRIGTPRAVPPLLELVRDLDDTVRMAAAAALGETASPDAVNALLDEMVDENPQMRMAVAEALGRINDSKSVEVLSRVATTDPDLEVRTVALRALRRISSWAVNPLIRALSSNDLPERIRAVSGLVDQGRAAILPLSDLMAHEDPSVRATAAEILGTLGDSAGLDVLARALADQDARVRFAAACALGRIKHARSAQALARALEDQDGKVAGAAAASLEGLGETAVEPVFQLLEHESADIRVRTIDVLGRLRHKGACDRLVRGLSENVSWVRIVSAQALGEICEIEAAPALIASLRDRDAVVRAMAAEALGKLRDYQATMPLLAALNDESDMVRVNALRALGRIGNPAAIPFLKPALDAPSVGLRAAAAEGLAALRVTDVLPRLRRMARPWPFSREPREVKEAVNTAIGLLTAVLDQEKEAGIPPEEGGEQ
jgi:HEAT repeat protein